MVSSSVDGELAGLRPHCRAHAGLTDTYHVGDRAAGVEGRLASLGAGARSDRSGESWVRASF